MAILAADIGGTKTLLQLRDDDGAVSLQRRYVSADYASFDTLLGDFLDRCPDTAATFACFGVAGPVSAGGRQAGVTNLPWRLDAETLAKRHGLAHVELINDFEAVAYSLEAIGPDDLIELQAGEPEQHGPRLVVGAGTGFGVGQVFWQDRGYQPQASEGGHMDFAATDPRQDALLAYLRHRWPHVSVERLLSGSGLKNIYDYLTEAEGLAASRTLAHEIQQCNDPAPIIAKYANIVEETAAFEAFRLFLRIYGAVTGNLALVTMATGGVYIAGGIAARNSDLIMADDSLLTAFLDKGRMRPLLERMPLAIIANQEAGLIGAAVMASRVAADHETSTG